MLFSVLVPNYGYSSFIFECLDSIITQTTNNLFDFEILVCDQSELSIFNKLKDEIFRKYGKKVFFYHSQIKSLYKARINLFNKAAGDYVLYVDSDDKLLPFALIKLFDLIRSSNYLDFYHFNCGIVNDNKYVEKFLERDSYLEFFLSKRGTYPIWKKCIRRKEITFFNEDIFLAEDALISLAFILCLDTFYVSNIECYFYRNNLDSGTKKLNTNNLNDLSLFLDYSIPYRKTNESKGELIYSFERTYIDISSFGFINEKLLTDRTKKIINLVENTLYKTKPIFFKKTFTCAVNKRNFSFKVNNFLLKVFLKFYHLLHVNSGVIIKD